MSAFAAIDGQIITDEKLNAWERGYAQGTFPEGERNLSQVAMKRALIATAREQQLTTSELVRITLAKSLARA